MTDQKPVLRVGVMGFSGKPFDRNLANDFLKEAFDKINNEYPDHEIKIVSGHTFLGIPALAYAHATIRGWIAVGVACLKAKDYPLFPCIEYHHIGKDWGDESEFFVKHCDIFVRIGGGDQSFKEIEAAKAAGKSVFEYDLVSE